VPQRDGPLPTVISVFRRAASSMVEELVARLDAAGYHDLTPSHHVVFENLDRNGTRLSDLALRAGMSHQSMGELVSALVQRGYVERKNDPLDGRARLVCLTDRGRRLARQALREVAVIEEEWRTRLATAELTGDVIGAVTEAVALLATPLAE
jgi:DNA-binding MarR family transcriptional regulator